MKKNWAPVWFELREEKGQSDLVTFMYQDGADAVPVRGHFPHRESDGLGRILATLKRDGIHLELKPRPLTPPPRWMNFFLLLKGLVKHPVTKQNPWKFFESKPSEHPDRVATITLSDEENRSLSRLATQAQVSPSFYLVSVMTDLIRRRLYTDPLDEAYWLFPVDLRGAFPQSELNDMILSFVPLHFEGAASAALASNYQKLRAQLKSGEYWAYHALSNIGDWIGRRGMKFIVDKTHEKSFWMGSFSDLGRWDQAELCGSPLRDRIWRLAPPGSPSYPVGFTNIEWCGKRTLSLRIQPSIAEEDSLGLAKRLLEELRLHFREAEEQRASSSRGPLAENQSVNTSRLET